MLSPKSWHKSVPLRVRAACFATPTHAINSMQLDQFLELPPGATTGETGVTRRFHARDQETVISLASTAAERALQRAEVSLNEVDLILAAGATKYQFIPTNAVMIHHALGAPSHIAAMDLDSTCLSFVSGLEVAAALLASGLKQRIMLINSELGSAGIDRTQRKDLSLFGDVATCFILELGNNESPKFVASRFTTISELHDICRLEGGASKYPGFDYKEASRDRYFFRMDGPRLFKAALSYMPKFVEDFLNEHGLQMRDIDLVIPHQASGPAVELLRRRLAIPKERCALTLQHYGNCISASLPLTLAGCLGEAVDGYCPQIKAGQKILLIGTGAGLTMAAALLEF